jgi:hypothetical protein
MAFERGSKAVMSVHIEEKPQHSLSIGIRPSHVLRILLLLRGGGYIT